MQGDLQKLLAMISWMCFSVVVPLRAAVTNYVTSLENSGPGSLRQAIADSRADDVIRFQT